MKFFVENNSSVPFHTQIKEQIKIALALGQLRDCAVLPSIREMEAELGIGRMVVLRAYRELERCGIVQRKRGRGVVVNHVPDPEATRRMLSEFSRLATRLEQRLARQGLHPTSFARFFYRRCLLHDSEQDTVLFVDSSRRFAQENAAQVSAIWEVRIRGISIEDLEAMDAVQSSRVRTIVTNYYRYEEIREIVRSQRIAVVPVSFHWAPEMVQLLRRIPAGSRVLVVQSRADFERHAGVFSKMLEDEFHSRKIRFEMAGYEGERELRAQAASRRYASVLVSNRVWGRLPADLQNHGKLFRPRIRLSVESILEGQIKGGILV